MPIGQMVPGTKETVRVTITDNSGVVTNLASSTPLFTIKDSTGTNKVTDVAASASGMVISCLIDTTVGGIWAEDEYRLFVKYTVGGEVIIKGPHYFLLQYA